MEKRKEFGRYIQEMRESKGISKRRAAAALGYKGLGTIHSVEQGINPLPVEKIYPLARIYEVDVGGIIEKLKECEPELYEKFVSLEKDFFDEFTRRVRRYGATRKEGVGVEAAYYRRPYGEVEHKRVNHNIYYQTQITLKWVWKRLCHALGYGLYERLYPGRA